MSAGSRSPYPVYVRPYPRTWWLRRGPYLRFAAREITSMFAAIVSGFLLAFLFAVGTGPQSYAAFLRLLDSPWTIAASSVILAALLYHVATWFRLTTSIVEVRVGGRAVPRAATLGALLLGWLAASALVAYFHIWF
jgi:fumarate reductase subunit C